MKIILCLIVVLLVSCLNSENEMAEDDIIYNEYGYAVKELEVKHENEYIIIYIYNTNYSRATYIYVNKQGGISR